MNFTFRPAKREKINLMIALAGSTNSGKTFTALRLATGITSVTGGTIAFIDTENKRALHYAKKFNFNHCDFPPPHSPDNYIKAIAAAEKTNPSVIVIDSGSHEHAGIGGVLERHEEYLDKKAGDDWKRRDILNMAAWAYAKQPHKKLMNHLLQLRAHCIFCFRAEQKVEMTKENGKTVVRPKKIASGFTDWIPVSEKNMLYEFTTALVFSPEAPGIPIPIKIEGSSEHCFDRTQLVNEEAGRKLAMWAEDGGYGKDLTNSPLAILLDKAAALSLDESDICSFLDLDPKEGLAGLSVEELRDTYLILKAGKIPKREAGDA
jgi:hypothetical protein